MKLTVFLISLVIVSLFLEITTTTLPLVFLFLLLLYIYQQKPWIFFIPFFFGIVLDAVTLKPVGTTSAFFLIFFFFLFLYERKFERYSGYFVFFSSFLGSSVYLWVSGGSSIIIQSLVAACLALLLFSAINLITKPRTHPPYVY